MTSPADVSSDLSVPFSLLAGTVRNATEAATLAHLDLLAIQAEAIDEHIAATARYASALTSAVEDARAAASKRERPGAEDGSVGLALLLAAADPLLRAEDLLRARAAAVSSRLCEVGARLRQNAEAHRATVAELQEEAGCGALLAKKRRRAHLCRPGALPQLPLTRDPCPPPGSGSSRSRSATASSSACVRPLPFRPPAAVEEEKPGTTCRHAAQARGQCPCEWLKSACARDDTSFCTLSNHLSLPKPAESNVTRSLSNLSGPRVRIRCTRITTPMKSTPETMFASPIPPPRGPPKKGHFDVSPVPSSKSRGGSARVADTR